MANINTLMRVLLLLLALQQMPVAAEEHAPAVEQSAAAATATENKAPPKVLPVSPMQSVGAGKLLEVSATLCGVLVLILLLAYAFKRFGGIQATSQGPIRLLAQMPVGVKERIMLIEVGSEQVLVGYSASGFETLHVLQQPVEVKVEPQATSFASVLKLAMGKNQ